MHSHVGRVDQEHRSHVLRERVVDGGLGIAEREPRGRIDLREHPHRFDAAQDHRHQEGLVEVARHRHPVARAGHPPQQRMVSVGRAVDREARVIGSPQLGGQRLGRLQVAARALQVVGATVQGQVEREQRVGETRGPLVSGHGERQARVGQKPRYRICQWGVGHRRTLLRDDEPPAG